MLPLFLIPKNRNLSLSLSLSLAQWKLIRLAGPLSKLLLYHSSYTCDVENVVVVVAVVVFDVLSAFGVVDNIDPFDSEFCILSAQ